MCNSIDKYFPFRHTAIKCELENQVLRGVKQKPLRSRTKLHRAQIKVLRCRSLHLDIEHLRLIQVIQRTFETYVQRGRTVWKPSRGCSGPAVAL